MGESRRPGRRESPSGRGREEGRVGAHLGNLRVGSVREPASEWVGREAARLRRERRGEESRARRTPGEEERLLERPGARAADRPLAR